MRATSQDHRQQPQPGVGFKHFMAAGYWWWSMLALVLCGCRHWPAAEALYPLGIYGGSNANDLTAIKEAGFNLVVGPARQDYLDAAQAAGLRVLATPNTAAGRQFNPVKAGWAIERYDRHPAVWGWYLVDEPELNQVTPTEVRNTQRFFKDRQARKPTALVLYRGRASLYFANIADILLVDRYPVPWLPLANVGQHLQQARLALGPKKPLMAVIQAFDWSVFPELMPDQPNLRPPTYAELRCMAYLALAHQVNGLFFYAYESGGWRIREHPETWAALKALVGEIRERQALFQAEPVWWPFDCQFDNRSQQFNAALESSISPALLRVKKGSRNLPRGLYLLLVNNTENAHPFHISIPSPVSGSVPVVGENRSVTVNQSWLQDTLSAYAAHIYGPLDPPERR